MKEGGGALLAFAYLVVPPSAALLLTRRVGQANGRASEPRDARAGPRGCAFSELTMRPVRL